MIHPRGDTCPTCGTPHAPIRQAREGDWMQTYMGLQFWPIDPRPEEICIEDIAHSLANQCRFGGHCTEFYSVAQHSVLVSQIVPPEDALWGLLHDAAEAYLVDLPRPVKRYSELGNIYRVIEKRLTLAVCDRFEMSHIEPDSVKAADDILLMTEKRDLMPNSPAKWREISEPLMEAIKPLPPGAARSMFLDRFAELTVGPNGELPKCCEKPKEAK